MDRRTRTFLVVGLIVVIVFAVGVSQFASDDPDGLEYVAEQEGFLDTAEEHALSGSPLADYGEDLTDNPGLNTAVAGVVGTVLTLMVGYGIFWVARRVGGRGDARSTPET